MLIAHDNVIRNKFALGLNGEHVQSGVDNLVTPLQDYKFLNKRINVVRSAQVRDKEKTLKRSVIKLCLLEGVNDE